MRRALGSITLTIAVVLVLACGVGASAAAAGPVWRLSSLANSTVAPGGSLQYLLELKNVGDADSVAPSDPTCDPNGPPLDPACVVLTTTVPAGVTVTSVGFGTCAGLNVAGPTVVRCASPIVRTTSAHDTSQAQLLFEASATVDPGAPGVVTSGFGVVGGGAGPATAFDPTRVSAIAPEFGIDAFDGQVSDAAGNPFTQAGGHPYAASTSIDFNTHDSANPLIGTAWPIEPTKDVLVDLPAGFAGNPTAAQQCTAAELAQNTGYPLCPPSAQVGTTLVRVNGSLGGLGGFPNLWGPLPVFNMIPPPGVAARFGFNILGNVVTFDAHVRSASDYGLSIDVADISEGLGVAGTSLTFWGVPADASHDAERVCPGEIEPWQGGRSCAAGIAPKAFLRNPTSCTPSGQGLETKLAIDSWPNPGRVSADGSPDLSDPAWHTSSFISHLSPGYPALPSQWGAPQGTTGCEGVPFAPGIELHPTTSAPASPSGLDVTLSMPQSDSPTATAQSDLRKAVVTLAEGMTINPSIADGLGVCTPEQIDLHGAGAASCPDASKIGSVQVSTPLLDHPLDGGMFLAAQNENPFHSNFAVYIAIDDAQSGVVLKLPGRIDADPVTGRLTVTFDNQPQLPFSTLKLSLKTGARAPLVTPPSCGAKAFTSELTGWSGKTVSLTNSFTVDCTPGLGGFAPSFSAGSAGNGAGAFSPFTVAIARSDLDQPLSGIRVTTPPGLLGMLSNVPLCSEPQAAQGTCPAASQIGHTTAAAGAGSNPLSIPVAGQPPNPVYLTGPYKGAPFGLSVVVPAIAGPFNLGTVVVRAAISVDRHTGRITIASDPLPQILQGVPLQLRSVNVTVDRPGFTFNPTSCEPLKVDGTISSAQGTTVGVSSPFQAASCASLRFKPTFRVSTSGKTSKANGASLDVKVSSGGGPHTNPATPSEANIAKVDVQLPVKLPSRLTTLQKACVAAVFDANPAACPAASNVGSATARTPVLPVPLTGPAYLVSHGGAAFPDLVLVLQGDGVRIDLTGNTQIKGGITYSHFDTVPDAPISSFELKLPQGPFSVLGVNGNLCANGRTVTTRRRVTSRVRGRVRHTLRTVRRLVPAPVLMPTTITAQNGAVVRQATRIAVAGCAGAKAARKARKANAAKGHRG